MTRGRFLVALHDDGGNLALILPILGELIARGHEVRVLAGPHDAIARAIDVVLTEGRFADAAARLAKVLSKEDPERAAARELEAVLRTQRPGLASTGR